MKKNTNLVSIVPELIVIFVIGLGLVIGCIYNLTQGKTWSGMFWGLLGFFCLWHVMKEICKNSDSDK